jgi:hypothetical protein
MHTSIRPAVGGFLKVVTRSTQVTAMPSGRAPKGTRLRCTPAACGLGALNPVGVMGEIHTRIHRHARRADSHQGAESRPRILKHLKHVPRY